MKIGNIMKTDISNLLNAFISINDLKTFRESSLLFDEKVTTIEHQRQISTIISHELGHQWFGNLVTPEWWDDLWLKEGFATYTEYIGVSHVRSIHFLYYHSYSLFLPQNFINNFTKL